MNRALGEIPLTVKLRTGVKEGKNTAHKLMPRLAAETGVGAITVSHPFTVFNYSSKTAYCSYTGGRASNDTPSLLTGTTSANASKLFASAKRKKVVSLPSMYSFFSRTFTQFGFSLQSLPSRFSEEETLSHLRDTGRVSRRGMSTVSWLRAVRSSNHGSSLRSRSVANGTSVRGSA